MTFAIAHNYFTVHWGVTGVSEQGQFGLRFDGAPLTTQVEVDGYAAQTKTWWQNSITNIQPNFNLLSVKVARIGTNGAYVPGATVWVGAVAQPAVAGGTGGVQFPLQCACVVTLRTAVAVGLAHSGRIYLPPLAGTLGTNQSWTQTMVNSSNASTAGWLSSLSGAGLGNLNVMSFGNAAISTGPAHLVTGCQTDGRPDVQRRRAAQLTPAVGALAAIS